MAEKILLIDGYSLLNRAFYGVPHLSSTDGTPTNGVHGFMSILYKLLDAEHPDSAAVAFDVKAPTFRHKMYDAYKGTRKPMPEDLQAQVPILKELLQASGISILELPGYEADDILGTVAKRCQAEGMDVVLLSGDRDLIQLVDEHITLFLPKTKSGFTQTEEYTPASVREQLGMAPAELIDVKALMGDSSDNIPGVPGVGEKTAYALIQQYHDIDTVYENIDNIKPARAQNAIREHFDMAKMSRELAEICLEAPLDVDVKDLHIGSVFTREAYEMMGRLELKNLMKRFGELPPAQAAAAEEEDTAEVIWTEDLMAAEEIFAQAEASERIALQIAGNASDMQILALTWDAEKIYAIPCTGFVTAAYLKDHIDGLSAKVKVLIVPELQELLRQLDLEESGAYFDMSVAAYLLNPLKNSYDYEDIARDYLGKVVPSAKELWDKKTISQAYEDDRGKLEQYLIWQAGVPFKAYETVTAKLAEQGMDKLFAEMEMPLCFSLHRMERAGIRVLPEALAEYGRDLETRVNALEAEIWELAGEEFNINSPIQLGEILFEKLGLPGGKRTKKGYSTAADVLEKIEKTHPIVGKILEYRTYAKLKSTYADGLAAYIGPDSRIHSHFQQTITATGRISSTEPNLQNIPVRIELGKAIRKVFVPADGCVFVDADYSQIELRVLAHMSGDKRLIEAYNRDADIHRITASEVFHVPFEEVTPAQRSNAKAVNFGIVYGISAFGLSEGLSISRKEANDYINKYFETYPGVKLFLDRQVRDAKEKGYVTTVYGRRRPVDELKSGNFNVRSFGERVAMNSPIQGTAADLMKLAMLRVDRALKAAGMQSRIVLQVHDELMLESPEAEVKAAKELLHREMKAVADFSVPLEVEVSTGRTWFETK